MGNSLTAFEDRAKAEFGIIFGYLSARPKTAFVVALVLGWGLRYIGFPWFF